MIDLYCFDTREYFIDYSEIPSDILSIGDKYKLEQDSNISKCAWANLYLILYYKYNIELSSKNIVYNKNNKPYITNKVIYFNISHCDNYIGIAISDSEVGIDIESEENLEKFKNLVGDRMGSNLSVSDLTDLWVYNEARIKMLGDFIMPNKLVNNIETTNLFRHKNNDKIHICVLNKSMEKCLKINF